jgi:fibronectin type 3 domain-containing protein
VSGATGYEVLRGTSSGGETLLASLAGTNYNDITAVGGTTYYYEVQATNATGASVVSSEVSATPTIALPSVPTGVTAIGTNGAVSLSWSVATGATSYNVKRSTTSGGEVTIANVGTPSYYDTSVANGQQYFYEVSSTNNAGESANSSEVSATPNLPPVAPTALVATAGTNQVSLSWTGSAGATSYNVKRATTSGGEVTIASSGTTNYLDTTAIKFTQYYYEVSAVNVDGESANSSEATATPTGVYGPTAYEPFNYPTGAFANNTPSTGTGFTGNWTIPTGASITTGLTYSGLTTLDNAYLQTASGFQNYENLANPLSSGTAFIGFLFKGAGDPGANPAGIYLPGNNASSLFCGFEGADNGIDNYFGLGSVSSSTLGGSTILGTTTPISNTNVHLIVLEIDFNTAGINDTVSLWIDPPVGVTTPGVAANAVVSSFDVGTISGFGYNVAGAYGMVIDEIKIGQVYGDVVGYSLSPTINPNPTTITTSLSGNQLTLLWPADHTGWTLQSQTNSLTVGLSTNWVNVPGSTTTNQVIVTVDPTQPTVFYQLEYTP